MSDPVRIEVLRPELFWFAAREDVRWLADPDDDRYAGEMPLRWAMITPLLRSSTDALRSGAWIPCEEERAVLPPVDLGALTRTEGDTLMSFFGDPIDADPWYECPIDGRHRTWGAWSANPDLILPLRSGLLVAAALVDDPDYVRPEDRQEYLEGYRAEARAGLSTLSARMRERSPRYVTALNELAS